MALAYAGNGLHTSIINACVCMPCRDSLVDMEDELFDICAWEELSFDAPDTCEDN